MNGAILCRMEEYNMTLHEYIEDMRGKRIAIIGIGVSNTPLLKLLLNNSKHSTITKNGIKTIKSSPVMPEGIFY